MFTLNAGDMDTLMIYDIGLFLVFTDNFKIPAGPFDERSCGFTNGARPDNGNFGLFR
jgi:hypothetical protein